MFALSFPEINTRGTPSPMPCSGPSFKPPWLQPSSAFAVVGFHILFSSLPPQIIKKHQTAKHTDTNLTDKSLTQRSTMRQHLLISRSSDPSVSNSGDLGVPHKQTKMLCPNLRDPNIPVEPIPMQTQRGLY